MRQRFRSGQQILFILARKDRPERALPASVCAVAQRGPRETCSRFVAHNYRPAELQLHSNGNFISYAFIWFINLRSEGLLK